MKKKMITIVALVAFSFVAAGAVYAFNCKIKSVDGETLVLDCKAKDAKEGTSGQQVKVKPKIEGC
nr:hypothetical protein [Desulfobulbaceae bacterium]